jgi:hypothetical protein
MTVTSADIAARFKGALTTQPTPTTWPTIAAARVYMPRDWPVQEVDIPILKIGPWTEVKESNGKAGITFTTTMHLEVIGEVARAGAENDESAGKVLTALGLFQREIELAIIGDPVLFGGLWPAIGDDPGGDRPGLIQQLRSVDTKMATRADGTHHRGAVSMTFEMNFYQGTEDFQLPVTVDIDHLHLYLDLINVADPSGTYIPPIPYPVVPAPRDHGPDGRIEGELDVPTS